MTNSEKYNKRNVSLVTCALVYVIPKSAKYDSFGKITTKGKQSDISYRDVKSEEVTRSYASTNCANFFIENCINLQKKNDFVDKKSCLLERKKCWRTYNWKFHSILTS